MTALSTFTPTDLAVDVRDTLNIGLKQVYNAKLYGLKGDANADGSTGTDDTAAFQALLATVNTAGGGTIFFPDGFYKIAGALQEPGASNAQIILPKINNAVDQISIRLLGATPASTGLAGKGAVLVSTLTTGNGNVIGCKNTHASSGDVHDHISWLTVYIENLTVRVPQNPTNSGIDLSYIPVQIVQNSRVDVQGGVVVANGTSAGFNMAQPTTATSYGIKGALNDIPSRCIYNNVVVQGFYTGVRVGELWGGSGLSIFACLWGLEIPEHRHAGAYGYLLVCNCKNTMRVTGAAEANIQLLDIEHDTASGSGPAWVEGGVDISDPSSFLRGAIAFHMHDTSIPFSVTGGANVQLKEAGKGATEWPVPEIFGGFKATQAYRNVRASSGQWPWLLITGNPNANDYVGFLAFVNEAIQKRVGGIYSKLTNNDPGSADMYIQTANGGTLVEMFTFGFNGNYGPTKKVNHLVQYEGNGDLANEVTLSNTTSATFTFNRPFGFPPAVSVSPNFDVGAGVRWWKEVTTTGVTVKTSAPVTGTFDLIFVGKPY